MVGVLSVGFGLVCPLFGLENHRHPFRRAAITKFLLGVDCWWKETVSSRKYYFFLVFAKNLLRSSNSVDFSPYLLYSSRLSFSMKRSKNKKILLYISVVDN
jgi:hypothetical protein